MRCEALQEALAEHAIFGSILTSDFLEVYKEERPQLVVVDFGHELAVDLTNFVYMRCGGTKVAVIDRLTQHADFLIHTTAKLSDWTGFVGKAHHPRRLFGPKYAIVQEGLDREGRQHPPIAKKLLVYFGESDPQGLAERALRGLRNHDFEVLRNVPGDFKNADLGLMSFGQAYFEALATGLPVVLWNHSPAHTEEARRFAQNYLGGVSVIVGDPSYTSEVAAVVATAAVASNQEFRASLSNAGRVVDGKGAMRVAKIIEEGIR